VSLLVIAVKVCGNSTETIEHPENAESAFKSVMVELILILPLQQMPIETTGDPPLST